MADSSTDSRRQRALQSQMQAMGWRNVPVVGDVGKKRWVKYYPPPHEVAGLNGGLKAIGFQADEVWRRDLLRAKVLAAQENYQTPDGV